VNDYPAMIATANHVEPVPRRIRAWDPVGLVRTAAWDADLRVRTAVDAVPVAYKRGVTGSNPVAPTRFPQLDSTVWASGWVSSNRWHLPRAGVCGQIVRFGIAAGFLPLAGGEAGLPLTCTH
jgi:hypothetical protein